MSTRASVKGFCIVVALLALAPHSSGRAEEFTTIPVIVNVLRNAGITEEEVRKSIADANEILKKAKARLTIIKLNKDVTDNGNNDGVLDITEWSKLDRGGRKEIRALVDEQGVRRNQKGKKIVFARKLPPSADKKTVVGISMHRDSVIMFGAGDIRTGVGDKAFADQMAKTVAHEVLHNLTLAEKHQVTGNPKDPKPADFSDGDGHTPARKANVMYPKVGSGNEVTDLQVQKIVKDGFLSRFEGKPAEKEKKDEPARKKKYQFGADADDLDDQSNAAPSYLDLKETLLSSDADSTDVHTFIQLAGLLPEGAFNARYALLWDTDADAQSGASFNGFDGMERAVLLDVHRAAAQSDVEVDFQALDLLAGGIPLFEGKGELLLGKKIEETYDDFPVASANNHQLSFTIPKRILALSATEIPVVALAESADQTVDTQELLFDLARFARDGTLSLGLGEAHSPPQQVPFQIEDLKPFDPFTLFFDDIPVFQGLLDASGGYTGEFLAHAMAPGNLAFITAQDSTGEFAFNVLVIPSPGTAALCSIWLAGLAWAGRNKGARLVPARMKRI